MHARTAMLCILASVAGATHAQDPGWYAGVAAGRSDFGSRAAGPMEWREAEDYTDRALAAYGGYRLGRHVAIEATYTDPGGYSFTRVCPGIVCIPEAYPSRFRVDARQLEVALMGILPLSPQWDVFAKAGRTRTDFDTSVREQNLDVEAENHAYDVSYAVGVRYQLGPAWKLRLQAQSTPDVGGSHVDLDAYLLGVEYGFGGNR